MTLIIETYKAELDHLISIIILWWYEHEDDSYTEDFREKKNYNTIPEFVVEAVAEAHYNSKQESYDFELADLILRICTWWSFNEKVTYIDNSEKKYWYEEVPSFVEEALALKQKVLDTILA